MEKYGTARQVTDGMWHGLACWITKATDTHNEHVILFFHSNIGYENAPQCYICMYTELVDIEFGIWHMGVMFMLCA